MYFISFSQSMGLFVKGILLSKSNFFSFFCQGEQPKITVLFLRKLSGVEGVTDFKSEHLATFSRYFSLY